MALGQREIKGLDICFFLFLLGREPEVSLRLSKHSTSELSFSPSLFFFFTKKKEKSEYSHQYMDSRKLTAEYFPMAWVIFMFPFLFLCFSLTFELSV